jgi:hypothetical protein
MQVFTSTYVVGRKEPLLATSGVWVRRGADHTFRLPTIRPEGILPRCLPHAGVMRAAFGAWLTLHTILYKKLVGQHDYGPRPAHLKLRTDSYLPSTSRSCGRICPRQRNMLWRESS